MPLILSREGTQIQPYVLSDEEMTGIGRLIRACAEMEDLVNLYLCDIANLGEGQAIVLLGRMSAAARLKLAETFAISKGVEQVATHKECFDNENYYDLVKCRNSVAHGILLGKTHEGLIAFQVTETMRVDESRVFVTVNAYSSGAFAALAEMAEKVIPQIEERLGLQASREKRRTLALDPRQKAQSPRKRKAKRARQRPPSRKK